MDDLEYEFMLTDRIAKIQAINEQYDLEKNGYIAFSGGKDSVVLSHLIDLALPNNKIPRYYSNTGIEYIDMVKFVKRERERDNRIVILNQTRNVKQTLNEFGYPFKSKEHSHKLETFRNIGFKSIEVINYLNENRKDANGKTSRFICPDILRYQFTDEFIKKIHISKYCCYKLKKDLMFNNLKKVNRFIGMTGMRSGEGGIRATKAKCVVFNGDKLHTFNPLLPITDEWENEYIKRNNIQLCKLYYPPYNFKRTGCKGCPYNINLERDLKIMAKLLPSEYKQCLWLWKPVYDEYDRIGYRLKYDNLKHIQYTLDDYLNE